MTKSKRLWPNWPTLALSALLAVLWLLMWRYGGGALDQRIYEALYAGQRPLLVTIARVLSDLGDPTVLIVLGFAVALWLWRHQRLRLGGAILAETLIGRGLSEIQNYGIARVRPALEPHLVVVKTSSFPSGHSTSSMIVGLTLALVLAAGTKWLRLCVGIAVLLSLAIGLSRVMLGVHWPSDVIGGWSFGALWVLLTLPLAERMFRADSS
jgi:membrane-associated phospholipid phosphatase